MWEEGAGGAKTATMCNWVFIPQLCPWSSVMAYNVITITDLETLANQMAIGKIIRVITVMPEPLAVGSLVEIILTYPE